MAFGASLTPSGLKTAAMFCLLFGAGGQLVAGLGNLLNKNVYGGTLFTSFAFNWMINWWALDSLSRGQVPDATVVFAVDVCFLIVFLVFTYGFGFFSSFLMAFLVDIDLLYVARIARHLGGGEWLGVVIGICTIALGAISLWIAFALLINPVAGRAVFAVARSGIPPAGIRVTVRPSVADHRPRGARASRDRPHRPRDREAAICRALRHQRPRLDRQGSDAHAPGVGRRHRLERVRFGSRPVLRLRDQHNRAGTSSGTSCCPIVEPGITLGELEGRFRHVRGHGMAKATVENALLILSPNQRGVRSVNCWAGRRRESRPGLSIGLRTRMTTLLRAVERAVAKGYHRIKMKVKKGQDIDWVRAVRDRFP